jgi:RNA polymerase sigma factor (sigma-70 family)
VWLRLVEALGTIRQPAALAGWLKTTAQRECLYLLRTKNRQIPIGDDEHVFEETDGAADEWLLVQERQIALRAAFGGLSERCRRLLEMLFADPPTPYVQISAELGMAVGAIGPNRQRCLDRLRASPAIAALLETWTAGEQR